jgi:hypothetical protein
MSQKKEELDRALHVLLDAISNLEIGGWEAGSTSSAERGESSSAAASSK